MTKLGSIVDKAPTADNASALGAALVSGTVIRGVLVEDFAGLGRVFVQMIGMRDAQRIEAECVAACAKLGIAQDSVAFTTAFEAEKAMRWLALGVREADNHAAPFGTLGDWERVDPDTIIAAWNRYGDIREQLAPEITEITPEVQRTIEAAISKKNATLLHSFGTHILASYLLSTGAPPQTSQTSSFSTTDSRSDS